MAPGQAAAVRVELDARRFVGPKAVNVYVQLDRPAWAEVVLCVRADSRPDEADRAAPKLDPQAAKKRTPITA